MIAVVASNDSMIDNSQTRWITLLTPKESKTRRELETRIISRISENWNIF